LDEKACTQPDTTKLGKCDYCGLKASWNLQKYFEITHNAIGIIKVATITILNVIVFTQKA